MDHTKSYSRRLLMKGKLQTSSRPRLSGKVSTDRLTEGARMSRYERINNTSKQKQKTPPFFRQSFFDFYSFVMVFPFSVSDIP